MLTRSPTNQLWEEAEDARNLATDLIILLVIIFRLLLLNRSFRNLCQFFVAAIAEIVGIRGLIPRQVYDAPRAAVARIGESTTTNTLLSAASLILAINSIAHVRMSELELEVLLLLNYGVRWLAVGTFGLALRLISWLVDDYIKLFVLAVIYYIFSDLSGEETQPEEHQQQLPYNNAEIERLRETERIYEARIRTLEETLATRNDDIARIERDRTAFRLQFENLRARSGPLEQLIEEIPDQRANFERLVHEEADRRVAASQADAQRARTEQTEATNASIVIIRDLQGDLVNALRREREERAAREASEALAEEYRVMLRRRDERAVLCRELHISRREAEQQQELILEQLRTAMTRLQAAEERVRNLEAAGPGNGPQDMPDPATVVSDEDMQREAATCQQIAAFFEGFVLLGREQIERLLTLDDARIPQALYTNLRTVRSRIELVDNHERNIPGLENLLQVRRNGIAPGLSFARLFHTPLTLYLRARGTPENELPEHIRNITTVVRDVAYYAETKTDEEYVNTLIGPNAVHGADRANHALAVSHPADRLNPYNALLNNNAATQELLDRVIDFSNGWRAMFTLFEHNLQNLGFNFGIMPGGVGRGTEIRNLRRLNWQLRHLVEASRRLRSLPEVKAALEPIFREYTNEGQHLAPSAMHMNPAANDGDPLARVLIAQVLDRFNKMQAVFGNDQTADVLFEDITDRDPAITREETDYDNQGAI